MSGYYVLAEVDTMSWHRTFAKGQIQGTQAQAACAYVEGFNRRSSLPLTSYVLRPNLAREYACAPQ